MNMITKAAKRYLLHKGPNSFVGALCQMWLGDTDHLYTDLKKIGYKPEHTHTTSRVIVGS